MIRWRLVALLICLILAMVAVQIDWEKALEAHDPIRFENFNKIAIGMRRQMVEDLLGCPPGDYGRPRANPGRIFCLVLPATWRSTQGTIYVMFNSDSDSVTDKWLHGPDGQER